MPSDPLVTLAFVTVNTITLLLGLLATVAMTYALWRLTKTPILKCVAAIDARTNSTTTPADGWYFLAAMACGVPLGGYVAGLIVSTQQGESLVDAVVTTVMIEGGAHLGVAVCIAALRLLGNWMGMEV